MSEALSLLAGAEAASTTGLESPVELAGAVRSLAEISSHLLASYTALAERAGRVDRELSVANAELAARVDELERLRAHLEAILQALPCGVVVRDAEGRIVRANAAAGAILGLDADELVARGGHRALGRELADGSDREIERPSPDGAAADAERRVVATRWSEVAREGGAASGCASVEILDDRTEIARLSERLQAQGRMAALGTLAGGIAHEIRNPLNAIGGFADLLVRELSSGSRHARFASRIVEGVREADAIIANLLSFADPERLQLETVDPAKLADAAIESGLAAIPTGAPRDAWRVTRRADGAPFVADRIKLRQALRNLVANAIEAQPNGGSVDVEIRRDGREIVCAVRDGGPGVPARLRARIVDPFFTTRAEGTGLGLALVHTIAVLHGGRFEVSPERAAPEHGSGAEMILRIPFNPA